MAEEIYVIVGEFGIIYSRTNAGIGGENHFCHGLEEAASFAAAVVAENVLRSQHLGVFRLAPLTKDEWRSFHAFRDEIEAAQEEQPSA